MAGPDQSRGQLGEETSRFGGQQLTSSHCSGEVVSRHGGQPEPRSRSPFFQLGKKAVGIGAIGDSSIDCRFRRQSDFRQEHSMEPAHRQVVQVVWKLFGSGTGIESPEFGSLSNADANRRLW